MNPVRLSKRCTNRRLVSVATIAVMILVDEPDRIAYLARGETASSKSVSVQPMGNPLPTSHAERQQKMSKTIDPGALRQVDAIRIGELPMLLTVVQCP